jgi:hypothetical protein
MTPDGRTRRRLLKIGASGALALGIAASTAGCFGASEANAPEDGADEEESEPPDPALEIDDDRYLSSAFPIEFVDPDFEERTGFADDARLAYVHWHGTEKSHWHQSPLEVGVGETRSGRTRFLVTGADAVPLGSGETFRQTVRTTADAPSGLIETGVEGPVVSLEGASAGETRLVFELRAGEELRWSSPAMPIEVS